jgi:hypothetical protein
MVAFDPLVDLVMALPNCDIRSLHTVPGISRPSIILGLDLRIKDAITITVVTV